MAEVSITPLRKRTLDGAPYMRDAKVEALLVELSRLSRDELVERALIARRDDARYVPSECLVHFIRASRSDNGEAWFERLYRLLAERVLRSLPKAENSDGVTASLSRSAIREKAFGRFVELLSADRVGYVEKLDYFEVRFDGALASLRRDAQKQAWRGENRSAPLYDEDGDGEPSPEVERAAGFHDPFASRDLDDPVYRSRLEAAIGALPPEQNRIIDMMRRGIPIDSKNADEPTIAKVLNRSEKTVRTYRDKAFAAIRAAMNEGDDR